MGLDMYLDRLPRIEGNDMHTVMAVEDYFEWLERGESFKDSTFDKWGMYGWDDLPDVRTIELFRPLFIDRYGYWDKEKRYPHKSIHESVGYWRKANQIHGWFVDNVQDGEDDCGMYEVTEDQLIELRDVCIDVLEHSVMMNGKVKTGETFERNRWVPIYEDGKVIINAEYAEERLPHSSGFFFGSDEYNEWYIHDLEETVKIINEVLKTTDFERQMICYCSSW